MKENPHNFLSYTLSSPYSHLTFTSLTESFYSPLETLAELEEWDGCVTLCWSRFTLMFQRNSSDWSVGGIWYVCLGKQFSHIFDLLLFFIIDVCCFFWWQSATSSPQDSEDTVNDWPLAQWCLYKINFNNWAWSSIDPQVSNFIMENSVLFMFYLFILKLTFIHVIEHIL